MSDFYLPENAEASIVGCLLIYPETKSIAAELITETDFASPFYGAAFSAAMELEDPDSVAFAEAMKSRGYTLPDGFFRSLEDIAINRYNLELYASLLREDSVRRQLLDLSQEIQKAIAERQEAREVISFSSARLTDIERGAISDDIASPDDSGRSFWEHRKLVESGRGAIPTGFLPLDAILGGGMLRSGLYVLAARPGMGKTTIALQFADSIAASGKVLFVSLEMSVEQIQGKRLARVTGIPSDRILLGDGRDLDYRKIREADADLRKLPVYVSRRSAATVAHIRQMARRLEGLECIVVDYLGKISPHDKKASRYEQVTAISADLKTLAVELGIPVLALAQLNRENTGRADKRPQLQDLRDSGAVEQDADGVIMLHRADYYEMSDKPLDPWDSVQLEIIVRKNRHGNIGNCRAAFFPATGRFIKTK